MKNYYLAPVLTGILLLPACAETLEGEPVATTAATQTEVVIAAPLPGEFGSELYAAGTTVRAEIEGGEVNTLTFSQDGTVRSLIHSTGQIGEGRWWVRNRQLCIRWHGTALAECWPYVTAWVAGETVTVMSDRGHNARITLIKSGTP